METLHPGFQLRLQLRAEEEVEGGEEVQGGEEEDIRVLVRRCRGEVDDCLRKTEEEVKSES